MNNSHQGAFINANEEIGNKSVYNVGNNNMTGAARHERNERSPGSVTKENENLLRNVRGFFRREQYDLNNNPNAMKKDQEKQL